MKQYRSSTNNSDGILSVSFSVHPPFILRSGSVRAPFKLRSSSVHSPFNLRSSSVHPPFGNRRLIEELTENHRRQNGDVSKL